jgi:MFS family permease
MTKTFRIAILSISFLTVMAGAAISPSLGEISKAFPEVSDTIIKMILTLPALFIIPFSLISGALARTVSKKKLLITGLIIYIIGGLGAIPAPNIFFVLLSRAVLGVGVGLIMPLSTGLIADFFIGEERAKMMGYSTSFSNLGGAFAILIAGFLANIYWKYTFFVYGIGFIVLMLDLISIKDPPKETIKNRERHIINFQVYISAIMIFLTTIVFYAVPTNIALYFMKENIGNPEMVGIATTFLTLSAFFAGMIFAKILDKLKKFSVPLDLLIMATGYIGLSIASSFVGVVISLLGVGFGLGSLYSFIYLRTSLFAPRGAQVLAMSVVSVGLYLGQFLSPIVISLIGKISGYKSMRFDFMILGIGLCVALIVSLTQAFINSKRAGQQQNF